MGTRATLRGRTIRVAAFCALAAGCSLIVAPGPISAETGPSLAVTAGAGEHPISPDIYGTNFGAGGPEAQRSNAVARSIDLPVDRWGGDVSDTYNWDADGLGTDGGISNRTFSYYFENFPDCDSPEHNFYDCSTPDWKYRDFIANDRSVPVSDTASGHTDTLYTLPMVGYKAKDGPPNPIVCGYPRSAVPTQDDFETGNGTDCGSGRHNGQTILGVPTRDGTPNATRGDDPTHTSINSPITATSSSTWDWTDNKNLIQDLLDRYDTAANGGVRFYELGNEPGIWSDTHSDMHPNGTSYDELWTKSRDLAKAVKDKDASAQVVGFSEWGWANYFCSGVDVLDQGCPSTGPGTSLTTDRNAHGGTPLVEWLMDQFKAYADAHGGARLLDYLDVHYYPAGNLNNTDDATRALWDPDYHEPDSSYIHSAAPDDVVKLIPRKKGWVTHYPGTKLAITEYNFSSYGYDDTGVKNAIVQGDVLGIFGREGVDLATQWRQGADQINTPTAEGIDKVPDAFRMYRNYDGADHHFGSTYVPSTSSNRQKLDVFGARNDDGDYTVMVINKSGTSQTSPLSLGGFTPADSAQVWSWDGSQVASATTPVPIAHLCSQAVGSTGFTRTYPAQSMTLFVIPAAPHGGDHSGDCSRPNTTITKAPKKKIKTAKRHVKVAFRFSSSESGSHFQCKLDRGSFASCYSGKHFSLKKGHHTFQVRAVDAAGNADASPATKTFRIVRRR